MRYLDLCSLVLQQLLQRFDVLNDPSEVIIEESKIADMSAIDALNKITDDTLRSIKSTFKTFKYGLSSTIAQC
jgi:hypothetical protein